ncbi:kunitz-type serine protease inhibitor kunitoxin-Phi1 [Bradysia coprophila]|uniref:kunitz-type serine protease inhibitor kunitoxin-Phi1 n=1 Tax=Bradysia coprophila TaxID=38358 RepID=UPI00187DD81F|nr:kunitz-type serine protease inhibitor kunitoxin-Phi1 [Bradysia coprophila]
MNTTSRKYTQIATVALIFGYVLLISYTTDAQPIDMYDEVMLSDEKLLLKMADLIDSIGNDEEDDGRRGPNEQLIESPAERCLLPIRKGVCRALIPRWSYDLETKKCVEFKFGGCDGNGNNFGTEKQCMDACEGV